MIRQGIPTFLIGLSAFDAQAASRLIGSSVAHEELSEGLVNIQTGLQGQHEDNPLLKDFFTAVQGYRAAVQAREATLISSRQSHLAGVIAKLPNNLWRQGTSALVEPASLQSFHNIVFLADTLTSLRHIAGSRIYTMSTGSPDKAFVRTIVGGLMAFLDHIDEQEDPVLAGMVEEVGAQIQDEAIQRLAKKTNVTFPELSRQKSVPPPKTVAAETAVKPAVRDATPEPAAPDSKPLQPFDYHPESGKDLDNKTAEHFLTKVASKMERTGVEWPYRFAPWIRTLYLLAADLPNGSSSKARLNITQGLSRLNKLATIDPSDIRRVLGSATIAVGRPLPDFPTYWPTDMANDFGSALIVLWDTAQASEDEGLRAFTAATVRLWSASAGQTQAAEIRGDLKTLTRRLERLIVRGEELDLSEAAEELREIAGKLPEGSVPPVDVPLDSSHREPEPRDEDVRISTSEWLALAVEFLTGERSRWGDAEDDRPLAGTIDRVARILLAKGAPATERAGRLLTLLFHLTLAYRQLSGVSGEAALVLGKDADTPLGAEDLEAALEAIAGKSAPRLEILQDAAEEANKVPDSYSSLLGHDGLPELVGRYSEYVKNEHADSIGQASLDFAAHHPELGLEAGMVRSMLAYFLGIFEEPFDATLLKEVTGELPAQTPPRVEIEAAVADEPLFRDINLDNLTPYGRAFFRVTYDHRPVVNARPRVFMIYVDRLSRIYQFFWKEIRQKGSSEFQSAFDQAFAKSKYLTDPALADKLRHYQQQYRALFSELLQFLDRNPDVADMVHVALLSGETQIKVTEERRKLRAAGGPATESVRTLDGGPETDDEEIPASAKTPAAEAAAEVPSEAPGAADREAVFSDEAVVSPDAASSDNPFTDAGEGPAIPVAAPASPDETPAPSPPPAPSLAAATDAGPAPQPEKEEIAPLATDGRFPGAIEWLVEPWGLHQSHRQAIEDMLRATNEETVWKVLQTISGGNETAERRRDWLEAYLKVVQMNRLSERAKPRLLRLMTESESFGRVAPLLPVAAAKPTNLILDRIVPDPPLNLGRRFGRFVATVEQRGGKPPIVLTRPAVNLNEAIYEEKAVTESWDSVVTWKQNNLIDIGVGRHKITGEFSLLRVLLKAEGAVTSGKRTSLKLVLFAPGISERARRFFFQHHPGGTILHWQGSTLRVYERLDGRSVPTEMMREYTREGAPVQETERSLTPQEGDVEVKVIEDTDWHPDTHRAIEEPTTRAIRRLEGARDPRSAARIRSAREKAIRAVGFLIPRHPDAQHVIEICRRFDDPGEQARWLDAIEALETAVNQIEARFEDAPPATITPPSTETAVPTDSIAAVSPPVLVEDTPPAAPAAEAHALPPPEDSDLPWTEAIRELLDWAWPKPIQAQLKVRKVTSAENFIRRAHQDIRHFHRKELFDNLRAVAAAARDPRLRSQLLAEFENGGRMATLIVKKGNTMSHADLAEVVRFAARATGITVTDDPPAASRPPLHQAPAGAASEATALVQGWKAVIDQLSRTRDRYGAENLPGFTLLRAEINAALSRIPDTAPLMRRLADHPDSDFLDQVLRHLSGPDVIALKDSDLPKDFLPVLTLWNRFLEGSASAAELDEDLVAQIFRYMVRCREARKRHARPIDLAPLNEAQTQAVIENLNIQTRLAKDIQNVFTLVLRELAIDLMDVLPEDILESIDAFPNSMTELIEDLEMRSLEAMEARDATRTQANERTRLASQASERGQTIGAIDALLKEFRTPADRFEESVAHLARTTEKFEGCLGAEDLTAQVYASFFEAVLPAARSAGGEGLQLDLLWKKRRKDLSAEKTLMKEVLEGNPEILSRHPDLAEKHREYAELQGRIEALRQKFKEDVEERLERIEGHEAGLPWSPPVAQPSPPSFAVRRFQTTPDTPTIIAEALMQVPRDLYEIVNSYPELALLAPDHEVYGRMLAISEFRKSHGNAGSYGFYEDNGVRKDVYLPPMGLLESMGSSRTVIDRSGSKQTIAKSSIRGEFSFERITDEVEEAFFSPLVYAAIKIGFFSERIGHDGQARDFYYDLFRKFHTDDGPNEFAIRRTEMLLRLFISPRERRLLTQRLYAVVRPEAVKRRLSDALHKDKKLKIIFDTYSRLLRFQNCTAEDAVAFAYLLAFPVITAHQSVETRTAMITEICGRPIEETAPSLRASGWVGSAVASWTAEEGLSPDDWRQELSGARLLSTPEKSHLVFGHRHIKAVERFLSDRAAQGGKFSDEVTGEAVVLKSGGRGFQFATISETPQDTWYQTLIARLHTLGDRPSPILDLTMIVFEGRSAAPFNALWREIVGLLMQGAPEEATADELRKRLALWAIAAHERLKKDTNLSKIVRGVEEAMRNQDGELTYHQPDFIKSLISGSKAFLQHALSPDDVPSEEEIEDLVESLRGFFPGKR
jgi:hypothetical protein